MEEKIMKINELKKNFIVFSKTMLFNKLFVVLFMLIGGFLVFRNTSLGNPLVDFTYQLENTYRIMTGQVPYKDFFLVLTPATYYLNALFLWLFGQSNIGQIVLEVIIHSVCVFLTNRLLSEITGNSIMTYLGTVAVALSESVNYPFVNYNSLCYLLMLFFGLYYAKRKNDITISQSFIAGFLVALPFYAKQNYGVTFIFAFYFFFLVDCIKSRKYRCYIASMGGTILTVIIFIGYAILNNIKIYTILYQTLLFSGKVKQPIWFILNSVKSMLNSSAYVMSLCVLFLYVYFEMEESSSRNKKVIISAVLVGQYIIMMIIYKKESFSLVTTYWSLCYIVLALIWFIEAIIKRKFASSISTAIISFFILMLGIFTKRLDGPMWLLCIIAALLYKIFASKKFVVIIPLLLFFLCLWLSFNALHVNYSWVEQEGDLQVEKDVNNKFYKIGINGKWLEEMENLTQYIRMNIGEKSFVEIPCEDPIYWATNSTPQLDFFQLYHETNPYHENELVNIINDANIEVIIVKRECQFKNYMITEDEIDEFERKAEEIGYKLIDQCGIYDILEKQ